MQDAGTVDHHLGIAQQAGAAGIMGQHPIGPQCGAPLRALAKGQGRKGHGASTTALPARAATLPP